MRTYASTLFVFLASALVSSTSLRFPLETRDSILPPSITTQINNATTFYRAVSLQETETHIIPLAYPLYEHPTYLANVNGSFSSRAALYVTHDMDQAILWGESLRGSYWYLVELHYYSRAGLMTKSFPAATEEWKDYVNGCKVNQCPNDYDIIEGPYPNYNGDGNPDVEQLPDGEKVYFYQAAFTTHYALDTLTVTKITKHSQ